jgi:penicillin-binding protein 1C
MRLGRSRLKSLGRALFGAALVVALLAAATPIAWALLRIPMFEAVRGGHARSDVVLLDRFGRVLHERRVDMRVRRGAWVAVEEVAPPFRALLLRGEDRRFEGHVGVDFRAVARALYRRVRYRERQGASTISMQLSAMIEPATRARGSARGWRKWLQAGHAIALELRWSKRQILEAYLNLVPFRGDVQGIDAAARVFFRRAPHALSEPEAAVLVAMLRAPNARPEVLARRAARLVADRSDEEALAEETLQAARAATGPVPPVQGIALAPHVAARLARGAAPGTRIPTTIDRDLQRFVQEVLEERVRGLLSQNVRDAAALVVDNDSGEVLAYVGGSGNLSSARYVDGVQARRQAGSTLKPFLYAMAFEARWLTPASLLDDSPMDVPQARGAYRPSNYDEQYRGIVSARAALAASLNIPAVRVLLTVGEQRFVDRLRRLGIASLERPDYYGPSIALGSADVRLWELATAYRAIARGGRTRPLALRPGMPASEETVLDPGAAYLVADILSDREARAATFGLENALATRVWSAVKTGTSKDMRDNWCIGFTGRYTVAVWVGNFSGSPMWDVSGTAGAAPAWASIVHYLHRNTDSPPPVMPSNVVRVALSDDGSSELFLRGTEPEARFERAERVVPQIRYPVDGMLFAVDPDIPSDRQRVPLRASGGRGLKWRLDGRLLGPADQEVPIVPTPGAHRLALVDGDGEEKHVVRFRVRGPTERERGIVE